MRIYILGIGGTLMGSVASLAKQLGHEVTGADKTEIYAPMSDTLQEQGIPYQTPYDWEHLKAFDPDITLIGNALSRGHPMVEQLLREKRAYDCAPHWLQENLFKDRHLIAVSGTHGKTTTASLLSFLLHRLGIDAGFLIGGIPKNFEKSAHLGTSPYFVIEADEYDTAFFDKRPKFIHWDPELWILNNIEYDHADIYPSLDAMLFGYHQEIRRLNPGSTLVIPHDDPVIQELISQGFWSKTLTHGQIGHELWIESNTPDSSHFTVHLQDNRSLPGHWNLCGTHQLQNLGAVLSVLNSLSKKLSISLEKAITFLPEFQGAKRRLEILFQNDLCTFYDDFAHHPTAIFQTLKGLKAKIGPDTQLIVAADLNSNSLKMGAHVDELPMALSVADEAYVYQSDSVTWDVASRVTCPVYRTIEPLQATLERAIQQHTQARKPCHVVFMSNGAFGNLKQNILQSWKT